MEPTPTNSPPPSSTNTYLSGLLFGAALFLLVYGMLSPERKAVVREVGKQTVVVVKKATSNPSQAFAHISKSMDKVLVHGQQSGASRWQRLKLYLYNTSAWVVLKIRKWSPSLISESTRYIRNVLGWYYGILCVISKYLRENSSYYITMLVEWASSFRAGALVKGAWILYFVLWILTVPQLMFIISLPMMLYYSVTWGLYIIFKTITFFFKGFIPSNFTSWAVIDKPKKFIVGMKKYLLPGKVENV